MESWVRTIVLSFVALGVGCLIWFTFFSDVHFFNRGLSQEDRAAVYVGAKERPKDKMKVEVDRLDCSHIAKADVDGSTLMLYANNDCGHKISYMEWHWQLESPDGTAIANGYTNQCALPNPGHAAECIFSRDNYNEIKEDDRASVIHVWTKESTY